MAQAKGTQTSVLLVEESTFATTPGTPAAQKLYVVSSSLRSAQNRIDSNTLSGSRSRVQPVAGNLDVTGSLEFELHAESMGTILKHAIGTAASTGANPYTHTLTIADLPTSFIIEHDYGSEISGAGRYEYFNGCRVSSLSLNFPSEGFCTASMNIMGAKSTLASASLDGTPTDSGATPFSSFLATIEEGGGAIAYVTEASMTLDNSLDGGIYAIGGSGQRRSLPEGFVTISGSVTALFESAALLNKAINSTESSLKLTLTRGTGAGSAGNELMSFEVQQLLYERTSPGIPGPNGISIQLPFKGYASGADLGFEAIVKNAVATV